MLAEASSIENTQWSDEMGNRAIFNTILAIRIKMRRRSHQHIKKRARRMMCFCAHLIARRRPRNITPDHYQRKCILIASFLGVKIAHYLLPLRQCTVGKCSSNLKYRRYSGEKLLHRQAMPSGIKAKLQRRRPAPKHRAKYASEK